MVGRNSVMEREWDEGRCTSFLRGLSSGTVLTIQVGGVGTLCWAWCESWWREMRLLIMERLELRGIVGTWLAE